MLAWKISIEIEIVQEHFGLNLNFCYVEELQRREKSVTQKWKWKGSREMDKKE